MTAMPLKERALKGAIWAALGGNGAQVLAFVIFIAISRIVGPAAFGVVAVCLLIVELTRAFTSECIAVNLVAKAHFDKRAFDAGFVLAAGASLLVTLALIVAAPLAALLFRAPEVAEALPILAPLLVVHALARLLESELTLRMAFRALAVRSVGAIVLGGGLGVIAAYAGYGIYALILQQWVSAMAALLLLFLQARWRPGIGFSKASLRELAAQSAALAPANLVSNLRQAVDGFAVASFSGVAAAGLYNLAKRTRLAFQLGLTSAIGRVALPAFGQLQHQPKRLAYAAERAMQLAAILAFPIFVGTGAIAPELIGLVLGPVWLDAAAPLMLLMIGGAIATTTGLYENLLLILGRRGSIVALHVFILALLGALILIVGRNGPVAIAGAVLLVGAIHNASAWNIAARRLPLRIITYVRNIGAPLAMSLAMLFLIGVVRETDFAQAMPLLARLALLVAIGAVFYIGASWMFARPAVNATLDAARTVLKKLPTAA
jgi:O-antigen/teichoic acid export membrane protein